jgi:hypothetical protein
MQSSKRRPFILPYEPEYTGHWEAEQRQRETHAFLRRREAELDRSRQPDEAPSIVPEMPEKVRAQR